MGTRGAYGFFIDGKEKVTYNHFDSYPEWLGKNVVEFIQDTSIEQIREIANKIILVGDKPPTPEQMLECGDYANTSVDEEGSWYSLLRNAQGELNAYENGLRYMIDNADFLLDSLFCEYAYIINLDQEVLEVYRGFNKNKHAQGRYAKLSGNDQAIADCYYGVKLVLLLDLTFIKAVHIQEIMDMMEKATAFEED